MRSTVGEMFDWLGGFVLGHSTMDKVILFVYITNAVILIGVFLVIFGREKAWKISLSNPRLFDWIPARYVLIRIDGVLLRLPVLIDYVLFVKQDWEVEARGFASNLKCADGFMIDAGSNVGHYTALLSTKYPDARIISVEASPKNFEYLKSNCTLNHTSNVTQYNMAVSDSDDKTVKLYGRDCLSTINRRFLEDWHIPRGHLGKELVRTITIDTLVKNNDIDKICLLKLDIEGAEVLALKGAYSTLRQRKVKNLIVEYHSKSNKLYVQRLLGELGYSFTEYERPAIFEQEDHANGHIIAHL